MEILVRSLTEHSGEALLFLCAFAILALVMLVRQARKMSKLQSRWSELLAGTSGDNLETLLYDHLRERMRMEGELKELRERVQELEGRMTESKRHMGLVRYDAFDDVGGNQSFALAIYDDQGNGAIVNSVVGRSDCRVYCKPLLNGRSERNLSQEEQRAIREARSSGPKSIVSP